MNTTNTTNTNPHKILSFSLIVVRRSRVDMCVVDTLEHSYRRRSARLVEARPWRQNNLSIQMGRTLRQAALLVLSLTTAEASGGLEAGAVGAAAWAWELDPSWPKDLALCDASWFSALAWDAAGEVLHVSARVGAAPLWTFADDGTLLGHWGEGRGARTGSRRSAALRAKPWSGSPTSRSTR